MLAGDGFNVVGIGIAGPPPLGRIQLELEPGVFAFYGQNGSGKSRALAAIAEALTGAAPLSHAATVDREVTVQVGASALAQDAPDGWLKHLRSSLLQASKTWATGRVSSGSDEAADVLQNPPRPIGALAEAIADLVVWREGTTLPSRVGHDGFFVTKARGNEFVVGPAVSDDALCEEDEVDLLFSQIAWGHWTARFLLGTQTGHDGGPGVDRALLAEAPTGSVVFDSLGVAAERLHDPNLRDQLLSGEECFDTFRMGWNPYLLNAMATLAEPPVRVVGWAPDSATIRSRTLQSLRRSGKRIIEATAEEEVMVSPTAVAAVKRMEQRANHLIRLALLDAPLLRLRVGLPDEWLDAHAPVWEAYDSPSGAWLSLEDLSSAQQRWAVLAIELALVDETDAGRPVVVLLDEPELALHRAAEQHMVAGLKRLALDLKGAAVIVATHSPVFLADAGIRHVHIHRSRYGLSITSEVSVDLRDDIGREVAMMSLGLRGADAMQLARIAVVVEGAHDFAVLDAAACKDLNDSRSLLIRMQGAKNTAAMLDAQILVSMTDAAILIVLDNIAEESLRPTWDRIRNAASSGDASQARASIVKLRDLGSIEAEWLAELAERAVNIGRIDRLFVFGLSEPDILFYLDPAAFGLNQTWQALHREWRRLPRDKPRFKTWLRDDKAATISTQRARKAAASLEELPRDLAELVDRIREVSLYGPAAPRPPSPSQTDAPSDGARHTD